MLMKAFEAKGLVKREIIFRELEDVEHELSKAIADCKDTFLVPIKLSDVTIKKLEDLGYTVLIKEDGNYVSFADAHESCDLSHLYNAECENEKDDDDLCFVAD